MSVSKVKLRQAIILVEGEKTVLKDLVNAVNLKIKKNYKHISLQSLIFSV